jgi:hypothetical protein
MRDGFESRCRRLGVWGNKHIPDIYLSAGTEQRLALLQGLLDTDGSIFRTERSSRVEFTSCRKVLAIGTLFLVRSLGWRATIRESAASLNGREVGRRWRVCFTPERGGYEPFRLRRKAERVQVSQSRAGELHAVSIVAIEPVESTPVRCIQVDRPDGLFLAGRDLMATHNSTLLRWTCAHTLVRRPSTRLVYASYAASLARTSGRTVRSFVKTHARDWGITVALDHADASDWQLAGHEGSVFTVGIGGGLTGRPADGLIIDDPLAGRQEADSEAMLSAMHDWWQSVARTRLAPDAWVIVVQTRWTEDDLAGRRVAEGWPLVNIPALADGHAPDALARPVGEWLESARGRTVQDWLDTRRDVGEREFQAMYQGAPAAPEGGIFRRAWFARDRVDVRPPGPVLVMVDPADNSGDGDEAGVLVGSMDAARRVYVGPDYSGHYTAARWIRVALLAVVRHRAGSLAYEQSLSGLDRSTRHGWRSLRQQATILRRLAEQFGDDPDGSPSATVIAAAAAELTHPTDPLDTVAEVRAELIELWPLVGVTLDTYPDTGPIIRRVTAKGTKELRAQLAAPLYEQRRISHIGHLTALEHQMATWQVGQSSPDRMDTAVHLVMQLTGTGPASLERPVGTMPTRSTKPPRSPRGAAITRSTTR